MKNLGKKLFIISFVLAVLSAALIFAYLQSVGEKGDAANGTAVMVATETIYPGTKIEEPMLKEMYIPDTMMSSDLITDKKDIIGKYTKETIFANELIQDGRITSEYNSDLGLKLKGNNRAITIQTNGEQGVARLISPGDFVDIIVSLDSYEEGGRIIHPELSKMVLQKIEVLAIDKKVFEKESTTEDGGTAETEKSGGSFLVTLSVPIFDVEKLVLSENMGSLKLALRPVEDNYIYQTDGVVWEEMLLDDFGRMKDFFPQYEVKKNTTAPLKAGSYTFTKYTYYTVKAGDTLRSISEKFYGDKEKYTLLKQVNNIDDEDLLISGTGIRVPVLQ